MEKQRFSRTEKGQENRRDKNVMKMRVLESYKVQTIAQFILGGIFIYASLGKVFFPSDFLLSVQNYKLLPVFLENITAYILPWIELVFGILLVLNFLPRFSASVLSCLLLVFILAITINLVRGIDVDCGCFFRTLAQSKTARSSGLYLITRDILFLILGTIIIFFSDKKKIQRPA